MISFSTEITSYRLTSRGLRKITRLANRLTMLRHRNEVLPRHFEINPETRFGGGYGYTKRGRGYMLRKSRVHGHQRPLTFSGTMRRDVLRSARVTATATRGRVIASGVWSQLVPELEAITDDEKKEAAMYWQDTVADLMARPEYKKKNRVRDKFGKFI